MSRHNTFLNSRLFTTATTAGMLLFASLLAPPVNAQPGSNAPIEFGAAQLPYVMILMDTSASMEWTDKGDAVYPELESTAPRHIPKWKPGTSLGLVQTRPTMDSVGPCYVWKPKCSHYERPSSCADGDSCTALWDSSAYDDMRDGIEKMRDSDSMRLTDGNMPRHVMIKEILAGDMVLDSTPGTGDPANRPGCWFVPRFKSAALDAAICDSHPKFTDLIDADDPRPHIQEVYDRRSNNGLLERMGNTVLLGVTMFDGYQYDGNRWGMNDIIAGPSPYASRQGLLGRNDSPASKLEGFYSHNPNDLQNYDLGIYRVIGPTSLKLSFDKTQALARYVQLAIADAGYVSTGNTASYKLTPGASNDENNNDDHSYFLEPYWLGKQPMAGATPLAAAMHDIYQYFLEGQFREKKWELNRQTRHTGEVLNPFSIANDSHRSCRPKHVIILTDGYPEPEAPGGAGNQVGSENMNTGFGYELARYPYGLTEDLIEAFVSDSAIGVDLNDETYRKHAPRVHIIGVNVDDGVAANQGPPTAENTDEVLTKLAVMAAAGNTCAQYYMPANLVPQGYITGMPGVDENGEPRSADGTCNPAAELCLQPQSGLLGQGTTGGFTSYPYRPDGPGNTEVFTCYHPALIFNRNDKATIRTAFQAVFNEIISSAGLASRTRPSMTSYLDVKQKISGQYRMYAGVKMEGGSPFWKGIINQESLQCTDGELSTPPATPNSLAPFKSLHTEISRLRLSLSAAQSNTAVQREDVYQDRRRLFTMIPATDWYDYTNDRGIEHGSVEDNRAVKLTVQDEFGVSYVSSAAGSANDAAIGIRIPFEHSTLLNAYLAPEGPFTNNAPGFYQYLNIHNSNDVPQAEVNLANLVNEVRGRSADKFDRVLGGIFQSNPVTVGPPDLAVPIDSYRDFRARFEDRPTMLYVGTLDGQLHAIYTGEPNVQHRQLTGPNEAGGINDKPETGVFNQREAWAYIPHMLHRDLQLNKGTQPRLLDGTPVVTDVRLCNGTPAENTNKHACVDTAGTIAPAEQWRTVLVQGLGDAGRGYFALDVTRTGDANHAPDPIPLWEFNEKWEFGQLLTSTKANAKSLFGPNGPSKKCHNTKPTDHQQLDEWQLPYMASSVGEAAIGTVAINGKRRAVAVFSAGLAPDPQDGNDKYGDCEGKNRVGRAIYVVDLQSGQMLRRFVDYSDGSAFSKFDADMVGTPALFDEFPGSLVTRGFVGDAAGALFRVDLSGGTVEDWKVTKFFDPVTDSNVGTIDLTPHQGNNYGPAVYRPALAMNTERKLVVVYGLGARGDTETNDETQFIIALEERIESVGPNTKVVANPMWAEKFDRHEKLTGEPVIFNNGVYFTTYHKDEAQDACAPRHSRIFALRFEPENHTAVGLWGMEQFADDPGNFDFENPNGDSKWFGPKEPTLIRGVAITMGASCADTIDEEGNKKPFTEAPPRKPQLVAQTGSAAGNQSPGAGSGSGNSGSIPDTINTITVDVDRPRAQSIPLSWTVITN